jgi:hypothetical protein
MVQLLKVAVETPPDVGNEDALEKFAFVSDTTLPLKPFAEIHRDLTSTFDSDMCIKESSLSISARPWEMLRSMSDEGRHLSLMQHTQWVVLSRPHAQKMVAGWEIRGADKPVRAVWEWDAMLPRGANGSGEAAEAVPAAHFKCPKAGMQDAASHLGAKTEAHSSFCGGCTDSYALFATIFGPLVNNDAEGDDVVLPGEGWTNKCRTFVSFTDKTHKETELKESVSHDPETLAHGHNDRSPHPWTFHHIGIKSMLKLRRSDFLFGRKFSPGIRLATGLSEVLYSPMGANETISTDDISFASRTPGQPRVSYLVSGLNRMLYSVKGKTDARGVGVCGVSKPLPGMEDRQWQLLPQDDGSYAIVGKLSGRRLFDKGEDGGVGADENVGPISAEQRWKMTPKEGSRLGLVHIMNVQSRKRLVALPYVSGLGAPIGTADLTDDSVGTDEHDDAWRLV